MTVQDDAAALRDAVDALERAAGTAIKGYGDNLDSRRLLVDVERVRQDVDLLCGRPPAPSGTPAAPHLQVMDDTAYPQDFWMDAEDEGLGGSR